MKFKCPLCKKNYIMKLALYDHMEREHEQELLGLPAAQIYFNFRNRYPLDKKVGKCVMTGKPTKFNLKTERYERFHDAEARNQYREYFKKNMRRVYGVDTLLTNPDHQKLMLKNRSISDFYKWADGTETLYTANLERSFLSFLENELEWENPNDIMAPAPMVFYFKDDEGVKHFHFPDFYISSMNLIINIKSDENQHYRLRDIEREKLQDEAIKRSKFNYIKIMNSDYRDFIKILELYQNSDSEPKRIFICK